MVVAVVMGHVLLTWAVLASRVAPDSWTAPAISVELVDVGDSVLIAGPTPRRPEVGVADPGVSPRAKGGASVLAGTESEVSAKAQGREGDDNALAAGIARTLRLRLGACRSGISEEIEQQDCQRVFAENAHQAGRISGTGDASRDAAFGRLAAAALHAYERRRTPPSDAETACGSGPMGECGAEVKVEIFSSTRGLLPNIARPED